jgi:hypothetical protein
MQRIEHRDEETISGNEAGSLWSQSSNHCIVRVNLSTGQVNLLAWCGDGLGWMQTNGAAPYGRFKTAEEAIMKGNAAEHSFYLLTVKELNDNLKSGLWSLQ